MLFQLHALNSVLLNGYFVLSGNYTEDLEGAGYVGGSRNSPERSVGNFS
jgi:hypothetical protein